MLIFIFFYGLETKIDDEPIINLPPKSVILKKVDFSTEEWSFYKRLESDSHKKFKVLFVHISFE